MKVILIAAITVDGFIARDSSDRMEWSQDLHLFKEQTMGFPVIMGSTTKNMLQKELSGRKIITVHRQDDPEEILKNINAKKCFIAGGGRIYTRFSPFLTHAYLTTHPQIFGKGIPLFPGLEEKPELRPIKTIPVPDRDGLFQNQFKVIH